MPAATKRSAAAVSSKAPAAKAAKKGAPAADTSADASLVLTGPLAEVAAGLALAELPQAASDMLQAMMLTSLGVTADQRGKEQDLVVEMLGSQLAEVVASLQKKVEASEAVVAECGTSKEELNLQQLAKGEEIAAKHEERETKKRELAEAAKAFQSARDEVDAARAKCGAQEAEIALAVMEKGQLTNIITEQFRPLADGNVIDAGELHSRIDRLVVELKPFKIDESMILALPSVLAKAPTSRAAFDSMVLTSLDEEMRKRLSAAEARIRDAEPTKAALAKALEEAEEALGRSTEVQMSAAESFTQADAAEATLNNEYDTIREGVLLAREGARKASLETAKAPRALAKFRDGPEATFATLRDARTQVAEPEAQAAAAEPTVDAVAETSQTAPQETVETESKAGMTEFAAGQAVDVACAGA